MKLEFFTKIQNYLLLTTLISWIFRPTGSDIFLIFLFLYFISIFFSKQTIIDNPKFNLYLIIIIFSSLALIVTTLFLKFASFGYHYLDLGYDHHLTINLLQNKEYYNKIYNISGFADHFSPSFIPFTYIFYKISASSFWLIFFKSTSIIIFSFLLLKLNKKLAPIILLSYLLFSKHNVSAINWEFDTTSLTPALILIIFFSIKKCNWLVFWISMVFTLGLKENSGVIWVCYGIYFIFIERQHKFGILLSGIGIIYMLIVWYEVIPFFAKTQNHIASDINFFRDIPLKIKYILMVYAPFFFLPFLNWRWLLFTIPALGINLIGKPEMYSGEFHYDDILSALIAVASLVNLSDNYVKIKKYFIEKKFLLLVSISLIVIIKPESPMQKLVRYFPDKKDISAYFELKNFLKNHPNKKLAIGTNISPLMDHANFEIFVSDSLCNISNNSEYIIFYDKTFRDQNFLDNCVKKIKSNKKWVKNKNFRYIGVFKRNT